MGAGIQLKGVRFGRWTVLSLSRTLSNTTQRKWNCVCDCGTKRTVAARNLRSGKSKSCGCLFLEIVTTHGSASGRQSPTYKSWASMKSRCSNSQSAGFHRYGGRGICVCKRWNLFENFLEDMGDRPSLEHSIDRKNNEKGYCKSNCRWSTQTEQCRNQCRNRIIVFDGRSLCLAEWADRMGLSRITVHTRLSRGWSVESALTTPVKQNARHLMRHAGVKR